MAGTLAEQARRRLIAEGAPISEQNLKWAIEELRANTDLQEGASSENQMIANMGGSTGQPDRSLPRGGSVNGQPGFQVSQEFKDNYAKEKAAEDAWVQSQGGLMALHNRQHAQHGQGKPNTGGQPDRSGKGAGGFGVYDPDYVAPDRANSDVKGDRYYSSPSQMTSGPEQGQGGNAQWSRKGNTGNAGQGATPGSRTQSVSTESVDNTTHDTAPIPKVTQSEITSGEVNQLAKPKPVAAGSGIGGNEQAAAAARPAPVRPPASPGTTSPQPTPVPKARPGTGPRADALSQIVQKTAEPQPTGANYLPQFAAPDINNSNPTVAGVTRLPPPAPPAPTPTVPSDPSIAAPAPGMLGDIGARLAQAAKSGVNAGTSLFDQMFNPGAPVGTGAIPQAGGISPAVAATPPIAPPPEQPGGFKQAVMNPPDIIGTLLNKLGITVPDPTAGIDSLKADIQGQIANPHIPVPPRQMVDPIVAAQQAATGVAGQMGERGNQIISDVMRPAMQAPYAPQPRLPGTGGMSLGDIQATRTGTNVENKGPPPKKPRRGSLGGRARANQGRS